MTRRAAPKSLAALRRRELLALDPKDQPAHWERRLLAGEIGLAHALTMCLGTGYPVPPEIARRVEDAFIGYEVALHKHLEDAFGIAQPLSRRKAGMQRAFDRDSIRLLVDEYHADGFPLTHPASAKTETAFDLAAAELRVSPLTVHRYYYSAAER